MTSTSIYYETLGEVIVAVERRARQNKAKLPPEWGHHVFAGAAMKYGETRSEDWPIESLNGKKTSKWFHVRVYRMDSGRYELVTYVF